MNRSDETLFDTRVSDWLEDDPHSAPDQALDIVLAAFPSIKQRHANRVPWRFLDMSSPLKLAFGAAAVAVVLGGVFLFGPWRPEANVATPPSPSPAATASAVSVATSPTPAPVTGLPGNFAFRRDDGDAKNVFLMRPDRSGLVQLTTDAKLDSGPMLSPDGSRVIFERTDPVAGNAEIWVVHADGTGEFPITQTSEFEDWPGWSPDGTRAMFTRTYLASGHAINEIVIRAVTPTAYLQPPEADTVVFRHESNSSEFLILNPTWSPDGSRVAFTSDLDGARQLYTVRVDGSDLTKLTTAGGSGRPAWSPDSSRIAYQQNRVDGCVWLVDASGDHSQAVAGDHCTDGPVAWSPDGTMVAWAGGVDMAPIWAVNVDGTNLRRLTADDTYADLAWGGATAP
jgi:Tol biopolymer transport system component